jgi:choline dehydrogenase-like flavoprotein
MGDVDAVVVGAGVIGLSLARALAESGRSVVVVEAADTIGTEISSRNSEVVHAGLYYPRESLKRGYASKAIAGSTLSAPRITFRIGAAASLSSPAMRASSPESKRWPPRARPTASMG